MFNCNVTQVIICLPTLLILLVPLPTFAQAATESSANEAFRLTAEETDRARALAEMHYLTGSPEAGGRSYFVSQHLEIAKEGDNEAIRLAHVVQYRYAGNLTIETVVNLQTNTVAHQLVSDNRPSRLAPEEVEMVRELVAGHPKVQPYLDGYEDIDIMPMVFSPPPRTELFGKRAVMAHLQQGQDFLETDFIIYVDLTNERVILEDKSPPTKHDHSEAAVTPGTGP